MKNKYYSLNKILEKNATYNVIFGQRGNGKTYAVLAYGLKKYVNSRNDTKIVNGVEVNNFQQMAIIRRYLEDFKGKRAQTMFDNLVSTGYVEKISNGAFTGIKYSAGKWYLTTKDENGDIIQDEYPFAFAFALTQTESDKSSSYPHVTTILFDEFISRYGYFDEEFILFENTISTIVRNGDNENNLKIFMCGNTVNKYGCPYFTEMGLHNVKNMKMGTIDVYTYGDSKLSVAVEYCNVAKATEKVNYLYAFNNPKLKMITGGKWELDIYAHLPYNYNELPHFVYIFIVKYSGEMVTGKIYNYKDTQFIYFERKTTPIVDDGNILIYSQETNVKPNYVESLTRPLPNIVFTQKVALLFKMHKVFYQDNEVGEIIRNYILATDTKIGNKIV